MPGESTASAAHQGGWRVGAVSGTATTARPHTSPRGPVFTSRGKAQEPAAWTREEVAVSTRPPAALMRSAVRARGRRCAGLLPRVNSTSLLTDAVLFASRVYVTRFFLLQVQLTGCFTPGSSTGTCQSWPGPSALSLHRCSRCLCTAPLAPRGREVVGLPLREPGGHERSTALARTAPQNTRARARACRPAQPLCRQPCRKENVTRSAARPTPRRFRPQAPGDRHPHGRTTCPLGSLAA